MGSIVSCDFQYVSRCPHCFILRLMQSHNGWCQGFRFRFVQNLNEITGRGTAGEGKEPHEYLPYTLPSVAYTAQDMNFPISVVC